MHGRQGWYWWFAYPFLIIGVAAWLLESHPLMWLSMVFFGLSGVALVLDALRTGVVEARVELTRKITALLAAERQDVRRTKHRAPRANEDP